MATGIGRTIVKCEHAKGLKTTDGRPPKGFWLSGNIKSPLACRYAFAANPA